MDIISHGLWAGAAGELIRRQSGSTRRTVGWTVVLGVLPDLPMLLPVIAWALLQPEPLRLVYEHLIATPSSEPPLPAMVSLLSHHAHCVMHSAVVALLVTAMAWWFRPVILIPLVGWWLHIVIDVPTHSSDYYAVPFLYPLTNFSVDGIAWTTPWLLAANYAALGLIYLLLLKSRASAVRSRAGSRSP